MITVLIVWEKRDKLNYQLAWTIVLILSLVWLWVKRDVRKTCLQIFGLLGESVLSNCLKSDVDVDAFLGWCFKVWNIVFSLTPLLCTFSWYLKQWFMIQFFTQNSCLTYSSILQINLVSKNYERKVFWIPRTCLDQKLISPWIQIFKCVRSSCIKYKNTTISTTIERNTERLETFLASCIPDLRVNNSFIFRQKSLRKALMKLETHLHRHNTVIYNDFLCQEISSDCGLVLIWKSLIHILIHQTRLSYTWVSQNDNFQQNLLSWRHF